MTQDEAERRAGSFQGLIGLYADGFFLEERLANGETLVSGPADSVLYLASYLEPFDEDGDGILEKRLVHWINLRLGAIDEERPHVRKIVSFEYTPGGLRLKTDDGRTIDCLDVDENSDPTTIKTLDAWMRLRDANREAYETLGRNLERVARTMIN